MKSLVTTKGSFGPFMDISVGETYYLCDGTTYPFTVVGPDATIGLYSPALTEAAVVVPQHVTSAQALSALHNAGLLDAAQAVVNASGNELVKIAWDRTATFDRQSPTLATIAQALGLTSQDVDNLFIQAAQINP